jgi:lysophospholipase L1-like esterase
MTPYHLETDKIDAMRRLMDAFGAAVAPLAKQHQAIFVDTQAAFDAVMKYVPPLQLADDGGHVGHTGHMGTPGTWFWPGRS